MTHKKIREVAKWMMKSHLYWNKLLRRVRLKSETGSKIEKKEQHY